MAVPHPDIADLFRESNTLEGSMMPFSTDECRSVEVVPS